MWYLAMGHTEGTVFLYICIAVYSFLTYCIIPLHPFLNTMPFPFNWNYEVVRKDGDCTFLLYEKAILEND